MATQKGGKPAKGAGNMDWSNPVRNSVDVGRSNSDKDESDVSIVIVLCLAIMAFTFVVAIPLLGMAYLDMHNATTAAVQEIKKMRELRLKMMLMMQGD
jgi:hypothetical protein